jgi:integrase
MCRFFESQVVPMPDTLASFDPFLDPAIPSLSKVLTTFESLPSETASRKSRARTAVATFSRLLKKGADQIPASGVYLRQRFMQIRHSPTGLSPKSLANCKSELRYLLKVVLGKGAPSALAPMSPEWAQLRALIRNEPSYWQLSRFMTYCSVAGLHPGDVDDQIVQRFLDALKASGDVNRPEQHVRQTIRTWNRLAQRTDWPQNILSVPDRRIPRWTIEPEKFSKPFRDEVDAWQRPLAHIDPEGEQGRPRPLRPESLKLHRHQVFKAATALVFSGRPIETIISLRDIVELDAFKAILKFLRERQGGKPTPSLLGLALTLKAIAKNQFQVDATRLAKMNAICATYSEALQDRVSRTQTRMENFEDERVFAALIHLSERLLREAENPKTPKKRARLLAQVAVGIEIEWHIPLRLKNLAELNLNTNVQVIRVKGQKRWLVRFDRQQTKNYSRLLYELPAPSVALIERALRLYEQPNGWLFPGTRGSRRTSHKQKELLGQQISEAVERRLGVPFNLHLFRSLVATLQIKENANGLEMARAMLGDRSDRVVRTSYTATAERHLIEDAQNTIQKVRIRTAPVAVRKKRKGKNDDEIS